MERSERRRTFRDPTGVPPSQATSPEVTSPEARGPAARAGPDGRAAEVALLDLDGVIVEVNAAWNEFCLANGGDPARAGVGISYLTACDAAHDPASGQVAAAIRAAIAGHLPAPMTVRVPCDGPVDRRTFDLLVSSRFGADGTRVGAVVTLSRTHPDHERADQERTDDGRADVPGRLAEGQERDRLVTEALDAISDGVVVVDVRTGRRLYLNQAVLDRSGVTADDLDEVSIGAPSNPQEQARIQAAIQSVVAGPAREASVESHVQHRDGSSLPVELLITYRPPAPGSTSAGRVILVSRDVSERHRAEQRIRASEESFRAAFEQSPIGTVVAVVDEAGHRRIVRANDAMADILGVPTQEIIGRDFAEFGHPDDEPVALAAARDLAGGRRRRHASSKRMVRRDGTVAWVEFRASRVDFPDVEGCAVLAHVVDVTDRHDLEERRYRQAAVAQVVAGIATGVLAGQPVAATYEQVVAGVSDVLGADQVALGFFGTAGDRFRVVAGLGRLPAAVMAADVAVDHVFARWLLDHTDTAFPEPPAEFVGEERAGLGPGCAVRFDTHSGEPGLLVVARDAGRAAFRDDEVLLLGDLTRQLALAVELGLARADSERLALLEERQRLARDLHDTVIQDLIAIGMQLDADLRSERDPGRRARQDAVVVQLGETVRQLRAAVFELREPARQPTLSRTVQVICADAARALGHQPALTFDGPVDDAVPACVRAELVAVLREALSNVARHARATATSVRLGVQLDHLPGEVTLAVEDDGQGIDAAAAAGGHGLANIEQRAAAVGGGSTVGPLEAGGTRLVWSAPLSR
jgi:PAS domain S-box-containing protein